MTVRELKHALDELKDEHEELKKDVEANRVKQKADYQSLKGRLGALENIEADFEARHEKLDAEYRELRSQIAANREAQEHGTERLQEELDALQTELKMAREYAANGDGARVDGHAAESNRHTSSNHDDAANAFFSARARQEQPSGQQAPPPQPEDDKEPQLKSRFEELARQFEAFRQEMQSFRKIKTQEYVEFVNAASARVRYAAYVLAVTSLIVFSSFWNVHPGGWLSERLNLTRQLAQSYNKAPNGLTDSGLKEKAQLAKIPNGDNARDRLTQLEKILYEQSYQAKIPFFGISYDINDLGMMGGFAFFIVLMILYFSLCRELANLRHAFKTAEARNELRDCFDLLSMGQVLTVPEGTGVNSNPFTRNLHRVLYTLPFFIQGMIVINDLDTIQVGMAYSKFNTLLTIASSSALYMVNTILICMCFYTSCQYDREWSQRARELRLST